MKIIWSDSLTWCSSTRSCFMISLGKIVKFTAIKNVMDRESDYPVKSPSLALKSVYTNTNIFIKTLYMDQQVWSIARDLERWWPNPRSTPLNPTSASPKIEIQIKVIKECVCSTWKFSPWPEIPETKWSLIWRRARYFWLNALPVKQRNGLHNLPRGSSWKEPLSIFAKTPQNRIWSIPPRHTKRLFPRKSML